MLQFNDLIERSDFKLVTDLLGSGLLLGGKIFENSPADNTNVLVNQRISYDTFGRRVAIQDLFADKISSIVRGLTLQNDSIAVPSTVGTYILFTSQPSSEAFPLVGEEIQISRSKFSGNNGSFTIQQVVVTDWGGLIPSQIMVRIDEELDEDGYESGLSPRGTTSLSRVDSTGQSLADVTKNELNNDVKPVNPGNERIVSLYARFDRNEFDTRLDGNALLVDFVSLEAFKFVIDDSEPEDTIGNANTPALRTNGDIFLADIRLENGADILQADIDTGRQTLITSLFAAASQIFELANAQVHGDQITWSGTNLSVNADLKISIPNKSFLYTVPAFSQALADGEILFVALDRTATVDPGPVHQIAARGSVPSGDEETLILVIADRNGTKLRGAYGGEMEPGETRDVGDSIGEAYLSFTGMSDENDSVPTYVEALLSGATSLQNADDILAASLSSTGNSTNQDRNLKLVKGGTYGPPVLSGVPADEVQRLLFSAIPDGGSITLSFNNVNTAAIPAPFTAADIATALNNLAALSTVIGSGAIPTADMTFGTADGAKDQPKIRVSANTLVIGAVAVTVDITVLTNGSADILNLPFSADAFIEVPGVELARNTVQQSVQSPIGLPADGSVAFVEVNRTPGVPANLVVQIGHIEDLDTDNSNIYVIARRVGNITLIGNGSFSLIIGESKTLDSGASDQSRVFSGQANAADSFPAYASNIRGAVGENLEVRNGVNTDAIGDQQEDRSAYLRSDDETVWTGTEIQFTADIVLEIINTKTGTLTAHTIAAAQSPLVLANNESVYIAINRATAAEAVTAILSGATPIPAQTQANKDVFVLFRRKDTASALNVLHIPLHKQSLEPGASVRLGASGAGGDAKGGLRNFFVPEGDAENVIDVSSWSTGNNAVFDGGGVFNGTFSISTAAADLIDGTKVYKWVGSVTAGDNDDDYAASPSKPIPQGYRGQLLAFTGRYKWDGLSGNMKVVVKDMTNNAILTEAIVTLDQFDNPDNTSAEFVVDFFCPSDCENVRVGYQVITGEVSKTLLFDEMIITPNQFVSKNLIDSQKLTYFQLGSDLVSSDTTIEFNLSNIISEGNSMFTIENTGGFTRFTSLRNNLRVNGHFTAATNTAGNILTQFKLNSTIRGYGSDTVSADDFSTVNFNQLLQKGDFFEFALSGNSIRTTRDVILDISAETEADHIISYNSRTAINSMIRVSTPTGNGSTDTSIRRFSVEFENIGTAITRVSTAVNGDTFTINKDGIYHIAYSDIFTVATGFGLSLNSSQLTTNIQSITATDRLVMSQTNANGAVDNLAWTGFLQKGDVIRPHVNSSTVTLGEQASFTITKIATGRLLGVPKPLVAYIYESTAGAGGTSTSDTVHTRNLNTVSGDGEIISLNSNQITIGPGTYDYEMGAPYIAGDASQVSLHDGADYIEWGEVADSPVAAAMLAWAKNRGRITITTSTTYELRHYIETGKVTNGLGSNTASAGTSPSILNKFAYIKLTKVR